MALAGFDHAGHPLQFRQHFGLNHGYLRKLYYHFFILFTGCAGCFEGWLLCESAALFQ
jgi:hypothetical protein